MLFLMILSTTTQINSEEIGYLEDFALAADRTVALEQLVPGTEQFYKDGYTDLRGRFDYASLSTGDLENVVKFGLLVASDKDGAVVREAKPPLR